MPPSKCFRYIPLKSDRHIRLIRVVEGGLRDDMTFRCDMIQVDRDDLPAGLVYSTISYRWGDERDSATIQIRHSDGKESELMRDHVLPRSTLYMLLDLAKCSWILEKWIWIDYLCLNQLDLAEKAVQVSTMGSVFELCHDCIIYLGSESDTTALGIDFWHRLMRAFDGISRVNLSSDSKPGLSPLAVLSKIMKETGTHEDSPEWYALVQLLDRPWFSRQWVLQEAVLSANVRFVWGSFSLHWTDFARLAEVHHPAAVYSVSSKSMDPAYRMAYDVWDLKVNPGRLNLLELIAASKLRHTTDPRDMIYGCLGLLPMESTLGITTDYSESTDARKLFTDFTVRMIKERHKGFWDVPGCAGIGAHKQRMDLPSWVPDYTRPVVLWERCSGFAAGMRDLEVHPPWLEPGMHEVEVDAAGLRVDGQHVILSVHMVDTVVVMQAIDPDQRLTALFGITPSQVVREVERAICAAVTICPLPWGSDFLTEFCETMYYGSSQDSNASADYMSFADAIAHILAGKFERSRDHVRHDTDEERHIFHQVIARNHDVYGLFICTTAKGRLAQVPFYTQKDDLIAVVPGLRRPYMLRPTGDMHQGRRVFQLVGTGYVHALNAGLRMAQAESELEQIVLR